jgi:hypothetical protein
MARSRMQTRERPLIQRKDVPDPDREGCDPRKGERERDERERSDRDAGAGRPVQLETGAGKPSADPDWPEPSKDAPAQK